MSAAHSKVALVSGRRPYHGLARFNYFMCVVLCACAQAHEDGDNRVQSVQLPHIDSDPTQALIQLMGTMNYGREDPLAKAQQLSFDADYIEDSNNPLERWTQGGNKIDLVESDGVEDFNCTAGVRSWRRGWSKKKKRFCCRTDGIGCEAESNNTSGNSSRSNSSGNGSAGNSSGIADNTTRSNSSNSSSTLGNTSDATNGNDTNVTAGGRKPRCVTMDDPRASSVAYTTSPAGTGCVFGVDERDEGWHCILDNGDYGDYGWCFTSKSRDTWGACSEFCPLVGQAKQIGNLVKAARNELNQTISREVRQAVEAATQMAITKIADWINKSGNFQITFNGGAQASPSQGTAASNSSNSSSSNSSNSNSNNGNSSSNGQTASTNATTNASTNATKKSDKEGADKAAGKKESKKASGD